MFAELGYHGAAMEEIARRSGVSVPVLYDHFSSKRELHRRLLERHFRELRALWGEHLLRDEPAAERIPRALDAWFAYVESHPYAWRMLFRDTTGDVEVEAMHRAVAEQSRKAVIPLLARELELAGVSATGDNALQMAWEAVRAVMQGLAGWWYEHREVPREHVVAATMNVLWVGLDRVLAGDAWSPAAAGAQPKAPRSSRDPG